MLGHISFGVADLAKAAAFYDGVLAALGFVRVWSNPDGVGYGEAGGNDKLALFAKLGAASPPGAGFHLAFDAPAAMRSMPSMLKPGGWVDATKARRAHGRNTAQPTTPPS